MEENVNLWNKKASDLTVGDQVKTGIAASLITGAALFVPLWVWGKIIERRELRELKNDDLTLVEDTDEDE